MAHQVIPGPSSSPAARVLGEAKTAKIPVVDLTETMPLGETHGTGCCVSWMTFEAL